MSYAESRFYWKLIDQRKFILFKVILKGLSSLSCTTVFTNKKEASAQCLSEMCT